VASRSTRRIPPPTGWRIPYTAPPNGLLGYSGMGAANDAIYQRVIGSGRVSKVALFVSTASGNISVAAYRGRPGFTVPAAGSQLATSGAVACPGAGYAEVPLGSTISLVEGDWLALSCDNTTATFARASVPGIESVFGAGFAARGVTQHPLPASPTGLFDSIRVQFILIGKP
jgi:hypothetical protein